MEKLPHETREMFDRRRKVYEKAMDLGHSTKNAVKYANIWANINYLGAKYPNGLTVIANQIAGSIDNL